MIADVVQEAGLGQILDVRVPVLCVASAAAATTGDRNEQTRNNRWKKEQVVCFGGYLTKRSVLGVGTKNNNKIGTICLSHYNSCNIRIFFQKNNQKQTKRGQISDNFKVQHIAVHLTFLPWEYTEREDSSSDAES